MNTLFNRNGQGYALPNILYDNSGIIPNPLDAMRSTVPWFQSATTIPANTRTRLFSSQPNKPAQRVTRFGQYFEMVDAGAARFTTGGIMQGLRR